MDGVAPVPRPEGVVTRGTTAPNRLRRADRWIAAVYGPLLRRTDRPLVVDLGFGASPVTTAELFMRLRAVQPKVEVVGIEIDPVRIAAARPYAREGLSFRLGGFELPVDRPPVLIRAFNVLRQYGEAEAWAAWDRLCAGLAPGGVLVEGTCGEIGRLATWVALVPERAGDVPRGIRRPGHHPAAEAAPDRYAGRGHRAAGYGRSAPARDRREAWRAPGRPLVPAVPVTITFAAHLVSLSRPSELAVRLPKTLIHRNVPGEHVHDLFAAFDHAWAAAAPRSVFGPRQRWLAAVETLGRTHPVFGAPPYGGRGRWRLGEVTLPWSAVAPRP